MLEAAANRAYQSGEDRRAYDLYKKAEQAYRRAGSIEAAARVGVRASRAWYELTGETPY
jgi:hypothetical protein